MRIINDNELHDGTYTCSNENLNYPVSNLDDPFMAKRFQATSSNTTIVMVLTTASTIDAVGHGLTNATSGTIRLYTGGPTTYTSAETISVDLTYDPCITYMTSAISSVTKIEVDLTTTSSYVYLGAVSAGDYYEIEYPQSNFARGLQDNTDWIQTVSGQSLANYQKSLQTIPLTFNPQTITESNALIDMYRDIGIGTPFFVDFFEGYRTLLPPLYACFSSPPDDSGIAVNRSITLNFQECK